MNGPEILYKYRGQVEAEVLNVLREGSSPVDEMLRYQMGWNEGELTNLGKCMRKKMMMSARAGACEDFK